jgi:rRNA maturation protein Nop10
MRIVHRISINSSRTYSDELAALGVFVESDGLLMTFEIDETDERWPELKDWVSLRRAVDHISTKFSRRELDEADWLELVPDWHHRYPQPREDEFGYREATYDLSEHCEECGVGLRQNAPFQMKAEPNWGRRGILQLNWVFDEFFVTPKVWHAVFEPCGVGCRPVTNRRGDELKTVVQLVAEEEVEIATAGLRSETCGKCGRVKFLPITRGPFPALKGVPKGELAKTVEWFGSGGSAHKSVLVSQRVRQALLEPKVRGASVEPVAKSEWDFSWWS